MALYLGIIVLGIVVSGAASLFVKSRFAHYSQIATRSHMTGADVARQILSDNGIHDVTVEPVPGSLSDHYDPTSKTLRLSEPVFASRSMAAFGVAAHEVGHAIQHAQGYAPLKFRSAWVPLASTGGGLSQFALIAAMLLGGLATPLGGVATYLGVGLFALTTIFTLITLPVEFDASKRALLCLENGGYATPDELTGAKKVLDAAAMTYVAAFVTSLMMLLYWAHMLGLFGGDE